MLIYRLKKYFFFLIFFSYVVSNAQVKYTAPNASDNLRNAVKNDPFVKVWAGVLTADENDVQKFADLFTESMFLWLFNNKLPSIQPIYVLAKQNDIKFKVLVKFTKFENNRTIAQAHSPIDINNVTNLNFKNIILVDYDKWVDLNKNQKMWLMSHEIMHELFATGHGEAGELMFPTLPSLDDNRKNKTIDGTNHYFTESETNLANALEKSWEFIWVNHCTKKGAFNIVRTLRQSRSN